jgi:hypothetical protein
MLSQDAESLDLLPDPDRGLTMTWSEIMSQVPDTEERVSLIEQSRVVELLRIRDKKEFQELSEDIWPPRTKTDLALRRTRLLDWFIVYRDLGEQDLLSEVLLTTREGWDIIFVQNVLAATIVFGVDWFKRWKLLGAFRADLAHFIAVAKKVHNLIKSFGVYDEYWVNYVECASLSGYRNAPFPGFDLVEETRKLAEGGEKHDLFGHSWEALVQRFLPMGLHPVEYVGFKDWVKKASWLTGGASSEGYLELELHDGKKKRVKARKNMVADIIDLGELADDSLVNVEQRNYAIVKSELGKLRIAVAGDIYTYLKMSWVVYLLGGAYRDWPGDTSEEDFERQTVRLHKMLGLCAKKLGLPYDYEGFDHQPLTVEIKGIVNHINGHARLNVPVFGLSEFDEICSSLLSGFDTASLEIKGEHAQKFHVTGGLMSGLRLTTIVGNGWNTVITGLVTLLLKAWGVTFPSGDDEEIERFIRGDDSAIFVDNWATGVLMNEGYKLIGAKAGAGKFALRKGEMEFLRVWFDNRCHGYGARSIPGLTQRKPWSNNPWSEDMVLKALYDNTITLKRRVSERADVVEKVWISLRRIWCRNHSLPIAVCYTPIFSGGLGIEPGPVGKTYTITPPIPKAGLNGRVKVTNQNTWRQTEIEKYAKERYDIDVSGVSKELAADELLQTVASDNVPDVARAMRKEWLGELKKVKFKVLETKHEVKEPEVPLTSNYYTGTNVRELLDRLKLKAPLFGKHPELANARLDYARFRLKGGFKEFLKQYYPSAWNSMGQFHRSWHVSEVIDYLCGKIYVRSKWLHPAMIKVFSWTVAAVCKPSKRTVRTSTIWTGSMFDRYIYSTVLSQRLYNW